LQSDRRTGLKKFLPNDRSESLFYYFRIEDQVPENHLLHFIDRYVSFDFVREKLRASYSATGRPSIDPEVLLRILLLPATVCNTTDKNIPRHLCCSPSLQSIISKSSPRTANTQAKMIFSISTRPK
jgi:hypothetical protein